MNNKKLLQVKTAVDPQYWLSAFLSYLKNNVKKQLIKNHISFKADQKVDSLILPPDKPELKSSVNFDPKNFFILFFFV